jgi:antitoxin HigA-1
MISGGSASRGLKALRDRRTRNRGLSLEGSEMPRIPIHPGEHLADELPELGISARELARTIRVPATRITDILRGRRGITGDTALRLGQYFGMSPDFWMNLQKLYELDLARQELRRSARRYSMPSPCRSRYPGADLVK